MYPHVPSIAGNAGIAGIDGIRWHRWQDMAKTSMAIGNLYSQLSNMSVLRVKGPAVTVYFAIRELMMVDTDSGCQATTRSQTVDITSTLVQIDWAR